jgi:thiamine-monophosphate kinase
MSKLGPGREFDAIREMLSRWGETATGIGDDAAVLSVPVGEQLVVSVDAFVEARHFKCEWLSPKAVGYRAATAALSDIAAMGATPLGVLFAVNLPDAWRAKLPYIGDGVADAVRAAGTNIIGGNISAATELSITTTVLGSARRPVMRSGAMPGDRVYVTGRLGGPGGFVHDRLSGGGSAEQRRNRFERPEARITEGRWLNEHGITAAIDISDGLLADAQHLAAASVAGLILQLERVPIIEGIAPLSAATSGEEYELLVTARSLDVEAFNEVFSCGIAEIGEVTVGSGATLFSRGARIDPPPGHDHLSA